MPKKISSLRQLSLLSTGVAMLALFVLMAGERWYSAVHETAENSAEQAAILSTNAGAALAFDDQEAATELLASLRKSSNVRQAALYRTDGSVLASFPEKDSAANWVAAPGSLLKPSQKLSLEGWRVIVPIQVNDRPVGAIVIWSSLEQVSNELRELITVFLLIASLAWLLAYASSHGLRRKVLDSQDELNNSQTLIRQLSVHRDILVEDEHKRIALEIHDDLGQILTTAMLSLKLISRRLRDGETVPPQQIDEVESLVRNAFHSIKVIAARLRPPVLDIGLTAALEWLAESMLVNAGIKLHLDLPEHLPPLDDRCSITLFRITQETLSNVVRHAQAEYVCISLFFEGEFLVLSIEDDGIGFESEPHDGQPHFGLLGMRERAAALQGSVEIDSTSGAGTQITVRLPLQTALMEGIAE